MIFQLNLTRGATGGVMFVDDASLEDITAAPEPASLVLLGLGGIGLVLTFLRRRLPVVD